MYPQISKKRLDKEYKPKLNKLVDIGKKLNINLNALKFDHFTNFQNYNENFANNGDYTNPSVSTPMGNNSLTNTLTNMNTTLYNANLGREYQLKTQELLQLENKDLNNQLVELQQLQTNIFSKERLIEDNMVQSSNYETSIRALSASILFGALLFLVIYLYGKNTMNPGLLRSIGVLLIVIYILVIFYIYNVMYLQESIRNIFSLNFFAGIGDKIQRATEKVNSRIDEIKQNSYQKWVQNNCSCPIDSSDTTSSSTSTTDSNKLNTITVEEQLEEEQATPGLYYQDGSSPNQLLYPPNTRGNSGRYRDRIDYLDFSTRYNDFPETRSLEKFENRPFGKTDIETQEEEQEVNIFGENVRVKLAPLVGDNVYTSGL
jgi:hypothetical protein